MNEITVYDLKGNSMISLVQYDTDVNVCVRESAIKKAYNMHFFNQNSKSSCRKFYICGWNFKGKDTEPVAS